MLSRIHFVIGPIILCATCKTLWTYLYKTLKFVKQGRCKFGNSCRHEHPVPVDTRSEKSPSNNAKLLTNVATEVVTAERGKQWRYSSFAPFNGCPNVPGLEDTSPEELRHSYYTAKHSAQPDSYIKHVLELDRNVDNFRAFLKAPTIELSKILEENYSQSSKNGYEVFSQQSASAVPQGSSSIFGGATISPVPFGGGQVSSSSIFSSSPSPNSAQSTGGNIFSHQSIFSSPNPQGQSAGSNIFSQPVASNASIFQSYNNVTSNVFAPSQNSSIFANSGTAGIFNSSPNTTPVMFPTPTQSQPIFGGSTPTAISGNPNSNLSIFQDQKNIFSGPGNQSSFSVPSETVSSANIFGSVVPTTGYPPSSNSLQNSFNPPQQRTFDDNIYSKLEELTEKDKVMFEEPVFAFGKIPLKPPAASFCT